MGLPKAPEARSYYRAAKLRFNEADFLLKGRYKIGAVYLAGYTVECLLKSLILDGVAQGLRRRLLLEFRGRRAHDIDWLKALYRHHVRAAIPREITRQLALVASWNTDLRYATVLRGQGNAEEFLNSVVEIGKWADGRM